MRAAAQFGGQRLEGFQAGAGQSDRGPCPVQRMGDGPADPA